MDGTFVSYCRVSTQKQGQSGLGLDAQKKAVADYLNGGAWELIGEFVEIESGKASSNRPELTKAIERCRLTGAKLVIAKLDRLSRDVHFLSGLDKAGVDFVCADMPTANKFTIHIMAAVAQQEREAISTRTKAALGSIKDKLATGETYVSRSGRTVTRLGNPNGMGNARPDIGLAARQAKAAEFADRVAPTIRDLRAQDLTLAAIADRLNQMRVRTVRGSSWSAAQVKRVLDRG